MNDNSKMTKEAQSRPMGFSHDIVPRVMPLLHETVKKYGKKCFIWLGPNPAVVILDAELIREIFTKYRVFEKPKHPLVKFLVTGLVSAEGDKWVKHRRIINPAFHIERLKDMLPAFHEACESMFRKWETLFSSKGSFELDFQAYISHFSGDVISRAAFGSNFEEGERFFQLQKEQADWTRQVLNSVYIIPVFRFLPTKMNRRMKQISNEMNTLLRGMIDKRLKAMQAGEAPENDLLGTLLKSNSNETQEHGNDTSGGMSVEDVMEECKLFYLAGEDTSKDFINWSIILLAKHQDWQTRAREEVLQVFNNKKPDHVGLNHWKIVTMILHESIRLYPPAVQTYRQTKEETKVGDISVPAGMYLILPMICVHHDKEIWGDDVHEFKPERFSEGVAKASKLNQVALFPFSTGPRTCIGQNFAMMEAKTIIAMILQRFTFELSPLYKHAPSNLLTLEAQYGSSIIFHKI